MTLFIRMFWFIAALFVVLGAANPAYAQLKIDITKGNVDPTPIAVPDFMSNNAQGREIGKDISEVVRANLERSGLFKSLDPASFIERQTNIDYQPTFADWRVIKAEGLVSGRIVMESNTRMRVEFRLWDIFGGQQLSGVRLAGAPDTWRRMAHKVSDAIYSQLTGETGYFDSRIVFIDESGPKTNRRKRLAIMDQDGANTQFLLAGAQTVITPRFSPNAQKITYMSYENIVPQIYLLDIETGRRELLGAFPGMTFAPRFAPNSDNMLLSLMKKGNSDIYVMDLRSRSTTQLTTNSAIDVSASFSPDGRKIVFNSDRSYLDEGPTWSPNGRVILFSRETRGRNGRSEVWSVDLTGQNLRKVQTPGSASDPAWSPLLP